MLNSKKFTIILYQPQIPQNTGNIVRTCSATGSRLRLVPPLGFRTEDKDLKRAGLDYWDGVDVATLEDFPAFLAKAPRESLFFFSSHAKQSHFEGTYPENSFLIFGSETKGLPDWIHKEYSDRFFCIPMIEKTRCLNLSNSVAIGLYEAIRQNLLH